MEAVVGLMVMLLRVSHGIETYCDGRQDETQCYGALGGTVNVQLMDSALEIHKYQWRKNGTEILSGGKNRNLNNLIENRSFFTPSNGTFRINNLGRNDGDEYRLEIYDSSGRQSPLKTLHLSIQAPVSSVLLVSECLSQGEMRVSCSSEGGDSPQYSWTLDGRTLTDAELLSVNTETNSITLKQHVSGRLVCSVRNHVSHVSKEKKMSDCGFIFISCTLTNGTHISQWVFAANNTLCPLPAPDSTTTSTAGKETDSTVTSRVQPTNITSSNQPLTSIPWYHHNLLILGLRAAVLFIIILIGTTVYFVWKKKTSKTDEDSAVAGTMGTPENSVLMVEMRSSSEH